MNYEIYVNGQALGGGGGYTGSIPLFVNSSNRVVVGAYLGGGSSSYENFDGNITDVAIYNSILSASQIASHYNAGIG